LRRIVEKSKTIPIFDNMKRIPRLVRWIFVTAIFFLGLMFLLRVGTYNTFKLPGAREQQIAKAFWLGFRFDARIVAVLALLLLLIGSIRALHPFDTKAGKLVAKILIFIFIFMLVFFYLLDFLHYRYLSQRLNASALSFLEDAKISAHMVWQTYPVLKIILGIVVSIFMLWWLANLIFRYFKNQKPISSRPVRIISTVVMFLVCALAIFGRVGQYPLRWSDAFNLGSDFNANIALNPIQSFFSSLSFRSSSYNLDKVKASYPIMAKYLGIQKPDEQDLSFARDFRGAAGSGQPLPNIVLVICESFSGYKSSMWGNPLNTTPYFNEMCRQGIFFDNCFTPHFGTARGVWASITGIPDVELVKTASRNPAMVDQRTIINDFSGYEKFYFLGGSTSWANMRGLLTNNISNLHLYEEDDYAVPKIDVWGISDKNLFLEANRILKDQSKPFFAVIQTADNHRPYTIPQEDLVNFKKVEVQTDSLKKYGFESNDELNAFRFTDYCYRQFIEAAKKEKYFSNCIFAFIGDHGIGGNAGTMFPAAWTQNGLTAYHVPMLFYSPSLLPAKRLHCVASQVDMLPTLAGLAKINYRNTTLGRDLLQQYAKDSCRSNTAFIMDHNDNSIGVVNGQLYYTRNQSGKQESLVWADYLNKGELVNNDSVLNRYRELTDAFYQTTRYMLFNNHKEK
jgi:phosphoglycerol transferase MdoB-like AlkP superfamily enzyme